MGLTPTMQFAGQHRCVVTCAARTLPITRAAAMKPPPMRGNDMSRRTNVTRAIIGLVAIAGGANAHFASAEDRRSFQVASFHDAGAFDFTNPHPDCTKPERGGCALAFDGATVETGDLTGSATYHGWLFVGDGPSQTFRWEVLETFTGKIAGCGRGSVQWRGTGYGDLTSFDASSLSARMWGTLTLLPGTGTRGLRNISGSLALEGRAYASPPAAQDGTLTGELRCDP